MLLHVLMFWGLLARPAGGSDWPAENYPVRTSRVMRKAGAARRRLAEKLLGPKIGKKFRSIFSNRFKWFYISIVSHAHCNYILEMCRI